MTGCKKEQIRIDCNNLQSKTKSYSLNTVMILKKTFLEYIWCEEFKRSILGKTQNIFEKSLHFGVAQASIYYIGVQVVQTAILCVRLTQETSFVHEKMWKVWFPVQL